MRFYVKSTDRRVLDVAWPEDWPAPRPGDRVDLPGVPIPLEVRDIAWHPQGDEYSTDPFCLIVVGLPRPKPW